MLTTHYFPESTTTLCILVSCALRQDRGAVPDRRGRRETPVQPDDPADDDSDVHHRLVRAAYEYEYRGSAYPTTYFLPQQQRTPSLNMFPVKQLLSSAIGAAIAYSLWKVFRVVWYHPLKSPLRHLRGPTGTSWILGNIGDIINDVRHHDLVYHVFV